MLFYSVYVSIFLYWVLRQKPALKDREGWGQILKALYSSPKHEGFQGSNIHTEQPGGSDISLEDKRTIFHLCDFPLCSWGSPHKGF